MVEWMMKVHCNPETVGKFHKGAVVLTFSDTCHRLVGHVEGFSMNTHNELVVTVAFCNGETHNIHHASLVAL